MSGEHIAAFEGAAEGKYEVPPQIGYVIKCFEALKAEGANERGEALDYICRMEHGSVRAPNFKVIGFFKHPAENEDFREPPRGEFPAITFSGTVLSENSFAVWRHMADCVMRDRNTVAVVTTRQAETGSVISHATVEQSIDMAIADFIVQEMYGHPARGRVLQAITQALHAPIATPVASPQIPEA
jgi:hypothetical protein